MYIYIIKKKYYNHTHTHTKKHTYIHTQIYIVATFSMKSIDWSFHAVFENFSILESLFPFTGLLFRQWLVVANPYLAFV